MTDLSIVLLTWNGRDLVLDCLASIEREIRARSDAGRLETETIVVDNGSADGSVEAMRARFPWAEVVALPRNIGFAAGNNAGLARAKGRMVCLLNNDTVVQYDGFEACVRHLDAHPEVGAVGPQLLHPDGRKQNSIHNFPDAAARDRAARRARDAASRAAIRRSASSTTNRSRSRRCWAPAWWCAAR